MLPEGYEYQSPTFRQAKQEGLAEGRNEGLAEGRNEGLAKGRAEAVVMALEARGLDVTPEQRERILSCTDPDVARRWIGLAFTANAVDELFQD